MNNEDLQKQFLEDSPQGVDNLANVQDLADCVVRLQKLEDEMIAILGTKVRLNHKGKNGGSIVVNYFSDDDLERILDILRSVD